MYLYVERFGRKMWYVGPEEWSYDSKKAYKFTHGSVALLAKQQYGGTLVEYIS